MTLPPHHQSHRTLLTALSQSQLTKPTLPTNSFGLRVTLEGLRGDVRTHPNTHTTLSLSHCVPHPGPESDKPTQTNHGQRSGVTPGSSEPAVRHRDIGRSYRASLLVVCFLTDPCLQVPLVVFHAGILNRNADAHLCVPWRMEDLCVLWCARDRPAHCVCHGA